MRVERAARVSSNVSDPETEAVLAAAERGLVETLTASPPGAGGLERALLTSVQVDGPLASIDGCGTFYGFAIPERYAIALTAVREAEGWKLHSWQVVTDGLHGPRQLCAERE